MYRNARRFRPPYTDLKADRETDMQELDRLVYGFGDTPHGRIIVARSDAGIRAVLFGEDDAPLVEDLHGRFPTADLVPAGMGMDRAIAQLVRVMQGEAAASELVLDLQGTPFQQSVWAALREIPAGDTASYADVAGAIGKPGAVRAVAAACAANPARYGRWRRPARQTRSRLLCHAIGLCAATEASAAIAGAWRASGPCSRGKQ